MVKIAPFRALRYDPAVAGPPLGSSAPAYDDVAPVAYAEHRAANPYTVLELIAPGAGGHASASDTLQRWLRTGVLVEDAEPALYLYELVERERGEPTVHTGVLAAVEIEPFGRSVLPHERVDPRRTEARRRRLEAVPVELSPVFALTVRHVDDLRGLLRAPPDVVPLVELTDEQGVEHRIWALTDPALHERLAAAFDGVAVMIADGHHRYAAALGARAGHALMYLTDPFEQRLRVRPIHRLVEPVPADLEARLAAAFELRPGPDDARQLTAELGSARTRFGVVLPGGGVRVLEAGPAHGALDVEVLHGSVLPLVGPAVVRYRTDLAVALQEAPGWRDSALFVLHPPDLQTVLELAVAGRPLPPKTTSFAPKPRTGLVLRLFGT